jgi:hypothetical protein
MIQSNQIQRRSGYAAGLVVGVLLMSTVVTRAVSITASVWQNVSQAIADNATLANAAALGTPDAIFFPGAINYDNRITGTTLNLFLGSPIFSSTSAGFNPNALLSDGANKNTLFLFTGQTFLNAGVNNFAVPHDDGVQLNINGIGLVLNAPGPTAPVVNNFVVNAPLAGLYDFQLSYGESHGGPAVLFFGVNGAPVGNVPDGGSTLMLLGLTMLGLLVLPRRLAFAA